jgi:hypothetical protein
MKLRAESQVKVLVFFFFKIGNYNYLIFDDLADIHFRARRFNDFDEIPIFRLIKDVISIKEI